MIYGRGSTAFQPTSLNRTVVVVVVVADVVVVPCAGATLT